MSRRKTTRTNTVAPERLEDAFFDLPISEQAIMLRTLNTLHRLACRNVHLNRDIAPKLPPPPDGETTEEMAARMARNRIEAITVAPVTSHKDLMEALGVDSEGGEA